MAPPRFHDLRIAAVRRETQDAVSVEFDVPPDLRDAYAFTPGQYLTLRAIIDGRDTRRSYSICSAPGEPLRVGIRLVHGGAFSTWAVGTLRSGDRLAVMTPEGRFGLPNGHGRTIAAFAAGSGITPILSIMKAVLADEADSRFFLFYGNRATDSILFRDEIEDLKDRFLTRLSVFHVLSRERQDVPVLNGHLDAAKLPLLLRLMPPPDHALVCGPLPMIEGLGPALAEHGLPADRLHIERFTPSGDPIVRAAPIDADAPAFAIVTVILDGARTDIPVAEGETIVDAALRAGRDLPYSCKGGMCCTCRARVREGQVEMAVNYSLEPWETDAGYVLTCQGRPITERVVVDFDAV